MIQKIIRAFSIMLLSALTVCCAAGRSVNLPEGSVVIKGIPFFSQEAYQCGPASLATVMNYIYMKKGKDVRLSPEEIASSIYSPTARGVLGIDLELYARKQGLHPEQLSGSINELKKLVDMGIPAIILVDYGFLFYAAHHFMVVTGYGTGEIIVNSGQHENQLIPADKLDRIWKRNNRWMLVLKP